jgi:hypothetical protein
MPAKRKHRRSQRRQIYCPIHGCHLDSVSRQYRLYADTVEQLRDRGISRKRALLLYSTQTTVSLTAEWLEQFWCPCCQSADWYHVTKQGDRTYSLIKAPRELWQQVSGVIQAEGNPSVSEFTRKQSRMPAYAGLRAFNYVQ